jgi:hypothetical protein
MRIPKWASSRRTRLTLLAAALSGLLSGAARAVADWVLHR